MEEDDLAEAIAGDKTYGDTVVIGTITSVTDDNRYADVHVAHVLRGTAGDQLRIESSGISMIEHGEPAYGPLLPLTSGERYVLVGFRQADGSVLLDGCGPSRPVTAAEAEALAAEHGLVDTAIAPPQTSALTWLGVLLVLIASLCSVWLRHEADEKGQRLRHPSSKARNRSRSGAA